MLADLGSGQGVLVRRIVRLQTSGFGESGFSILQKVHLQADSAKAKENQRVVGLDLFGPYPVGEGMLEFTMSLCDPRRLLQSRNRLRIQAESLIVVFQRPAEILF